MLKLVSEAAGFIKLSRAVGQGCERLLVDQGTAPLSLMRRRQLVLWLLPRLRILPLLRLLRLLLQRILRCH